MINEVRNIDRPGYGPRPVAPTVERRSLSPARAAVLEAVLDASQPVTLADLSAATGLHPNTLREHLEALLARELVRRTRSAPQGRGRPAWLYQPVEVDLEATGAEYAGLAATLAAHIHRTSRNPAADAVAAGREWGRDLAHRTGPPEGTGPEAARRQVTRVLAEVGFAPTVDDHARTVRLTRCPLLETAREYPDVVCGVHLGIVRGALEEYGADSEHTDLFAFSEPGACRLELQTRTGRR